MIDYHCHLLSGLDDGPGTVEESLEMARALVTFGFREVCCTPHCIKGQYEISPVEVRETVRRLQSRLDYEGVTLTLYPGMEYFLDEYFEQYAANLLPLGDSQLVLCEAPPQAPPGLVGEMAGLIVVQGYLPLIAHPERSDVIWEMLEEEQGGRLKAEGSESQESGAKSREPGVGTWWRQLFSCSAALTAGHESRVTGHDSQQVPADSSLPDSRLFQANLGSFAGFYGPVPQRRAYELLQRGVYHCLASDLHEARTASASLDLAREKLTFNPALRKLGDFKAPQGQGGSVQLAFW